MFLLCIFCFVDFCNCYSNCCYHTTQNLLQFFYRVLALISFMAVALNRFKICPYGLVAEFIPSLVRSIIGNSNNYKNLLYIRFLSRANSWETDIGSGHNHFKLTAIKQYRLILPVRSRKLWLITLSGIVVTRFESKT